MAEVKLKVLEFANKVTRTKMGSKNGITVEDPRYYIMEPVITDEMAEVALCMEFRVPKSIPELAKLSNKSVELTHKLVWELADHGICLVDSKSGEDRFWYELWVPGIMEMMCNNKENVRKYPQIAKAFEEYGRILGPKSIGKFPMGVGVMRVIPIERAIDGETRKASYEEISGYLEGAYRYSVSDCSCRTSREALGEGCGHLKEDMCIQLDHAAEYYIRTNKGREITKAEAYEIIRRAEDNGLMHQIPNLDGSGKTHAICNCCGCSCYAVRIGNMFKNTDMIRSNYLAKIDKDKCVACGECVENCPTNALKLGQKLCTIKPIKEKKIETPRNMEWTPDRFNTDYRTNRDDVVDSGTSPCKTNCPAHISIQGYIKLASLGKYKEALELIKHENPFPAVCGRICPRSCESACTRSDIDEPIAIDEIKKFIAEQDLNENNRFIPKIKHDYEEKIAIIGAGPAGLSCAYYLAVHGYKVTVFEKHEKLGGMLTLGIPSFRLEKDVVSAEIEILKALNVEFKTGVEVGTDVTLAELRKQGFKGFYVAVGAQKGRMLNIEGENSQDVISGVDFLVNTNLGKQDEISGKVVVIGGGNVAIDVARVAVRCENTSVNIFCLENREQMPALVEEIDEALSENIVINNSYGPVKIILDDNNKVTGVLFKKCLSVFDANKRFAPVYDENDTIVVECDKVLISVGQAIDYKNLFVGSDVTFNPNNTIIADGFTFQTNQKDIFTGGDCYTGPRFAIDAIASGKQGAISLHRYVKVGQSLVNGRDRRLYHSFDKENLNLDSYDVAHRASVKHNHDTDKFKDNRLVITEADMLKETKRCLGCGASVIDEYMCIGCGQCTTKCKFDAIKLVRVYDNKSLVYEDVKPAVVKHVIKRQGKIAIKKIKDIFDSGE